MTLQAFRSRRVVTLQGIRPATVLIENEIIREILPHDQIPPDAQLHDFADHAILPGLVDSHVHINDPGRADWEGFPTATRAAAAGGYTLLVDMPLNCLPGTTTVAALEAKRAAAKSRAWVDWSTWGGIVSDNQSHIEPLAAAGVPGFKCFLVHPGVDGFTMVTEPQLRAALPDLARTNLPLLVHAELPGPIDRATQNLPVENWPDYQTYLQSRPDEAELCAIELLLNLCREYKFRLHIVHLATAKALPMLQAARAEGLPVTVETCPHYLYFSAEKIPNRATLFKCAPPIRSAENREQLWQALREGTIDFVVTDHSPCPPAMKRLEEGNFRTAWGGIASLSLALSIMHTEARTRGFTLLDLAHWMSERPARLASLHHRKGQIAPNHDADLVIFDPETKFQVTEAHLHFRHPISPYLGETLQGQVKATYLRGHQIYADQQFSASPLGHHLQH